MSEALAGGAPARYVRANWSYEALLALLVGAETCVLYLGTEALFAGGLRADATIAPPILFALLFFATTVQRAVEGAHLFSPEYETVTAVAFTLSLVGAVYLICFAHYAPWDFAWARDAARGLALLDTSAARPIWGVAALVAYAWWRGRTRDEADLDAAYRMLRIGTPICVVFLLISVAQVPAAGGGPLWRALYIAVVTYFLCALAAIALARLRIEQARGTLTLTPRWLGTFLWPIAALLVAGMLAAGLFTRRLLDTIVWLLTPLLLIQLVLLVLVYVATALAWVVITFFTWLLARLGPIETTPTPGTPTALATPQRQPFEGMRGFEYPEPFRYLLAAALLVTVGWALTRFLWRRRRPLPPAGESRESVFSWALLGDEAAGLLRRVRDRLRRPGDPLAHLRGDPRWAHTLVIRETYRRLLRRGADAALPRAPDETPDEYQGTLDRRFHSAHSAVATLTERYDDARYGGAPATAADAEATRAAWKVFERATRTED